MIEPPHTADTDLLRARRDPAPAAPADVDRRRLRALLADGLPILGAATVSRPTDPAVPQGPGLRVSARGRPDLVALARACHLDGGELEVRHRWVDVSRLGPRRVALECRVLCPVPCRLTLVFSERRHAPVLGAIARTGLLGVVAWPSGEHLDECRVRPVWLAVGSPELAAFLAGASGPGVTR